MNTMHRSYVLENIEKHAQISFYYNIQCSGGQGGKRLTPGAHDLMRGRRRFPECRRRTVLPPCLQVSAARPSALPAIGASFGTDAAILQRPI